MYGVNSVAGARGWPATAVFELNRQHAVVAPVVRNIEAEAALLTAVAIPPRIGEARPIAALLPEVLARYGLNDNAIQADSKSIDCLA
jgi:hypothetical protein